MANIAKIMELYTAYFNRAADKDGVDYWANEMDTKGWTLDDVANTFAQQTEYTALYAGKTNAEIVALVYTNVLNRTADADGAAYWKAELDSGAVTVSQLIQAVVNAATEKDANGAYVHATDAAIVDNKTEVSQYAYDTNSNATDISLAGVTEDKASTESAKKQIDADVAAANKGQEFQLTDGRDFITGTDGNDTFYALAGQNQNGAIANAFATGDVINGGAGSQDTLEASLVTDGTVADGETLSINGRTTNLEIAKFEVLSQHVEVEAGRMDSVKQFWSDNSDETLVINDVRLGSKLAITKDITFGMKDVDQKAGLIAAFESQSLVKAGASTVNSSVLIRVADVSTETNATPVANVDITIGFTLGATAYVLENVQSVDGTYAGLKAAIEAALTAKGLTGLTVEFGDSYTDVTAAGNTVNLPFTAQEILITDPEGKAFSGVTFEYKAIESIADQFLVVGNASAVDPTRTSSTIETNLILDNAGRGSTAGDVVIGGMSNSNKAIETLNLSVDRDSKIAELSSAYAMETTTATTKGTQVAFETIKVKSLDAKGDLTIGNIFDTKQFDSTSFAGENLKVTANIGEDDTNYTYNTGASNDTVIVNYADVTNKVDTGIAISTGAGNDNVEVNVGAMTANDYSNSVKYGNFTISTGAGNDTIKIKGNGDWTVDAGSGNDTVYADNSGAKASWVVGTATATAPDINLNDLESAATTKYFLVDGKLTVTFTDSILNKTAAIGTVGYEVIVDIPTGDNYTVTNKELNEAIMTAINEDAVMNKLLVAVKGPANTLIINSLIDGAMTGQELNFSISTPDYADTTVYGTGKQNAIEAAYEKFMKDSTLNFTNAITASANNANVAGSGTAGSAITTAINGMGTSVLGEVNNEITITAGTVGKMTVTVDGEDVEVTITDATNATTVANAVNTALTEAGHVVTQAAGVLTVESAKSEVTFENGAGTITATIAATAVTGTESLLPSDNVINLGLGNDVVVLGTTDDSTTIAASSNDTIVIDGLFGYNTVVNFDSDSATDVFGDDALDFTAILNGQYHATGSTSAASVNHLDNNFTTSATLKANEVIVLDSADALFNTTYTWANLTAGNLLNSIKNDSDTTNDFGNIDNSKLNLDTLGNINTSITGGTLVGTTVKNIVMIENDTNLGEYKVFELTGTVGATSDFTAAKLLGTLDFGESFNANTVDIIA